MGSPPESADELLAAEVDLLTSGNHIWAKREIVPYLSAPGARLLRPANYPRGAPGRGSAVIATPDGRRLGVVNLEGRQTYVNPAFCEMVGWAESELIGAKPPFLYWPSEDIETIATALARVINEQPPSDGLEMRFVRKTGERFDVFILVTPLCDNFGNVSGWLSSISDITRLKQAEAELRRSHENLELRVRERTADLSAANAKLRAVMAERRKLEHELLDITEKERRRIGLDLHDDLGQKLSGVALMAKGLQLKLAKQRVAEAKEAVA